MPKYKKPIYKFSINNLILINSVYPFDFFIRVNNFKSTLLSQAQSQVSQSEKYTSQDSPIIKANADQCDEVFPWEFAVNNPMIRLQFVEISKINKKEIIRSEHIIDEATQLEGKTIVMNAFGGGKKLCIVHYILQPYIPIQSQGHDAQQFSTQQQGLKSSQSKSSHQDSDQQQGSLNNLSVTQRRTEKEANQNKSGWSRNEKVRMSEKQHEQLQNKIAQINKSIDRILDHQRSEHAIFSKYLDESTSFIKEIMKQSKANKDRFDAASAEFDGGLQSPSKANPKLLFQQQNHSALSPDQQQKNLEVKILPKEQRMLKDQQQFAMESISQSQLTDSELSSAQWYKEKYNKDKPQIYKNKNFRVDNAGSDAIYEVSLKYSDSNQNQNSMIFSDLQFNTEIQPNQISFADPHSQSVLFIAKSASGPSYDWKKPIQLPKIPAVIISVKDEFCKEELNGCIAKREMLKMRVSLFDRKGEQKGQMKFKNRTIGFCSVQTQQMLNMIDRNSEEQNEDKAKELNENEIPNEEKQRVPEQKGKALEEQQKLKIENEQQIDDAENKNKEEQKISPNLMSVEMVNKSDTDLVRHLNPKEKDFERLLIQESDVRSATNKSEGEQQNIEDLFVGSKKQNSSLPNQAEALHPPTNKQHSQIEKDLVTNDLNCQPLESKKKEDSPGAMLKSRKNSSFQLKQASNQFLHQSSEERVYQLPITQQRQSKRPSRMRGLSVESSRAKSRNTQIQERGELENKQENNQINEKMNNNNIVSNSVSVSYLPFMKKQTLSQRYPDSSFISDEELSQVGSSNQLTTTKGVSFKIDSISIKLLKNSSDFTGKFVKISMRNKSPYLTETINLSNNLTWKGKGYVFDNASPYGELILYLFNDDHSNQVAVGKAKICLALLNLDKHNIVQFHHDFVRNESEQQIGQIVLGYERIDKNRRTLSVSNRVTKQEFFPVVFQTSTKKRKRKAASREKAGSLHEQLTNRTEKNRNFGIEKSQVKSIIGAASVIRTKKYTGGNIIIGRAARFRTAPIIENPGPGDYELKSSFEKHISPL